MPRNIMCKVIGHRWTYSLGSVVVGKDYITTTYYCARCSTKHVEKVKVMSTIEYEELVDRIGW